jgi:hypothetical protein
MPKMALTTIGVGVGDIIRLLVSAPGIIGVGAGKIVTGIVTAMITTVTVTMIVAK